MEYYDEDKRLAGSEEKKAIEMIKRMKEDVKSKWLYVAQLTHAITLL